MPAISYYMVLVPEKINTRYSSYDEAFGAAKEYLRGHRDKFVWVPIYEMSDGPKRTIRYVCLTGKVFHTTSFTTETT